MCGIFGFILSSDSKFKRESLRILTNRLFILSESRGKEASGLLVADGSRVDVLKLPVRAKTLIKSKEYSSMFTKFEAFRSGPGPEPVVVMGHARMVTNGSAEVQANNQPVTRHGIACLHNGIVVNDLSIWSEFPELKREFEVDTEIILSLMEHYRKKGSSMLGAVRSTFAHLKGANTVSLLAEDVDAVILATTNGSLFCAQSISGEEFIFASEKYILDQVVKHATLKRIFNDVPILSVKPNSGYAIALEKLLLNSFTLKRESRHLAELPRRRTDRIIRNLKPTEKCEVPSGGTRVRASTKNLLAAEKLMSVDENAIASLRRCTNCILPHTFPFISYDDEGTCNYCRNYKTSGVKGETALEKLVDPLRKANSEPDCIVPLSGGRDSTYGIHYLKKVMKMNPVAYTYDWGLVTDLARRNISRVCGELGIEHILISADITKKRENVKKNVSAWLNKPDLGTVPLFMAGDKQFFYYASLLRKQMNIGAIMFCMNPLERTDFKSAFCGIDENYTKKIHWNLSIPNKLKLMLYYGRHFLRNPAYLNSSIVDTLFAFMSYYMIPRDFLLLFNFISWEERKVNGLLAREYDWEKAEDTRSTWRIGDGTAPFYNYIYYRVTGFTENDTFRSNQIREGQLERKEALDLVKEENRPRPQAIQWYCDTVGIDWSDAIQRINQIPRLYIEEKDERKATRL